MSCTQCGQDTVYKRQNDKRCAACGYIERPKTGLIDERPCRPYDSDCGEVVHEWRDGRNKEPVEKVPLCNDGTCCSYDATTMRQINEKWVAVCTMHKE